MFIKGRKQTVGPFQLAGEEVTNVPYIKILIACILAAGLIFAATQISWLAGLISPLIIIAGVAILLMAWLNWEFGVKALLVIVIFEGAIRKWFLPDSSDLVYFYKDFVMLASLIGYLWQRNKPLLLIKQHLRLLLIILTAFVVYAAVSVSNPSVPHPLVGVFGVRAYCLYMPLVFMMPRMFPDRHKLVSFLRWYLLLIVPVFILSVAQFRESDRGSSLNRYAWNQEAVESGNEAHGIAVFEDSSGKTLVRVTGTFSYISGLAIYLPVVFAMLLGLTQIGSSRRLPRLQRWFFSLALAAVVATGFMTGSRSVIVKFAAIALIFFTLTSAKRLRSRLPQIAFGGVLIFLALTVVFPEAWDAMKTRALGDENNIVEGQGRITEIFRLPADEAALAGAFGYGIGATQNSVSALMTKLDLPFQGEKIPIGYEEESPRIMLELGVVGYLLYGVLRLVLFVTLWKIYFDIKDKSSKSLAAVSLSVLSIYLFVGGSVLNHTQSVYQWFLVGTCFALLNAEKLRHTEVKLFQAVKKVPLTWNIPLPPAAPRS